MGAERRFGRRTVLAASNVLERLTQAELSRFLLELAPQLPYHVRGEDVSCKKRLNDVIEMVDACPDFMADDGRRLEDAIVEKAVATLPGRDPMSWEPQAEPSLESPECRFLKALEADGFSVENRVLRRTLPSELHLPDSQDELSALLDKFRFTTPSGHYEQARDAHARANWASANGQLRTFIEALLDEIALRIVPTASEIGPGQGRRAALAKLGFLSRSLNEWDDQGSGYINGLVRRLNPQGSHPGLSDEEDCTFRLHTVMLTARLLLKRLDSWKVS